MSNDARGRRDHKTIDRIFGIPLVQIAGIYRRTSSVLRQKKNKANSPDDAPRVGVIGAGAIGDIILATGMLAEVANLIQRASVDLWLSPSNRAIAPLIDKSITIRCLDISAPWQALADLRTQEYDILIDLLQWPRVTSLLAALSRSDCRVGFATPLQHREAGYDVTVPHLNSRHEIDNFRSLLTPFGEAQGMPARLFVPPESRRKIAHCGLSGAVVIHPWAAGTNPVLREWRPERWAIVAEAALGYGRRVVLTGSRADQARTETLRARLPAAVESAAGILSLQETAALCEHSGAVVSVNTGIMHLAAVLGAPTVGLHGPTNPKRWGPVGPRAVAVVPSGVDYGYLNLGFEYPKSPPDSMGGIAADSVIDAMERLMAGTLARPRIPALSRPTEVVVQ
ncbi:glycosyltransferase family 9 protein [Skermanella mucosa]|uniref:glycosyltransferase family 9 protein n=1 Tax=Skermanella mucosa TaxID=1789672 RepID=UPI00192AD9A1|nr:glycosyltransferase family 9 protein [Skermanella mucosa]UEM18688.1 glycosyltransferase family 9 protein [Skermanella mucosa]